ncbi:MAG TPA: PQQ-binding-like beta-propeller repeat protein, partial [Candidatus Thermoplasmatota archaeon]|nr:PQQ-binding-like beta-propeller repeat protein [Candidatus Thermoplasmatota archaeon]
YAINSNGTLKWKYATNDLYSSPAIGDDGTIYFGDGNQYINALYPNGMVKWKHKTDNVVYSSPAIGTDGTVYCGSHDTYLYALYPNNGSLKWKFKTGDWVRVSPCIADDGTIYIISLDNYLYAIFPNGTMKWKTNVGAGTSSTIGQDGTIYCGYSNLYAVNPTNGSVRWTFNPGPGRTIRGATPCNSVDGTIYFGTWIGDYGGGEIIAVNPNGTEQWRRLIANRYVDSAPAIGEDGTVYVGTAWDENGHSRGYLYALGWGPLEAETNGPYYSLTNQSVNFTGSATGGYKPYTWHWDFGDGDTSKEQNPTHTYSSIGNYTVTLMVTDNTSNTSIDTTWAWIQTTNTPPNTPMITGPSKGKPGIPYNYTFLASDPDGTPIWYYIQWGDGTNSGWIGSYPSDNAIIVRHTWDKRGTYIIQAKAKDGYGSESDWGSLNVKMPISNNMKYLPWFEFIERLFERYPHLFPILQYFLNKSINEY